MSTGVTRLLEAFDRLVAEVAARGDTIDTAAIVEPAARRVARVEPPRRYEVLLHRSAS